MDLETLLFSQGFGSRRQCRGIVAEGRVRIGGETRDDPRADIPVTPALEFEVDDHLWTYREKAYVALNKPAGYECSRDPQHHLSVFHLLPPQLAERGVQAVGRLDQDTTGLLLLSDDGAFVHAFTSPKRKVPKVYLATVRHPLDDAQLAKLREGVLPHGETKPSAALRRRATRRAAAGTDRARRQISSGEAHGRGRGKPRGATASRAGRRLCAAGHTCRRRVALAR